MHSPVPQENFLVALDREDLPRKLETPTSYTIRGQVLEDWGTLGAPQGEGTRLFWGDAKDGGLREGHSLPWLAQAGLQLDTLLQFLKCMPPLPMLLPWSFSF